MKIKLIIALSLISIAVQAQYKQQLRGTVVDQVLQKPLAGATVSIAGADQPVLTDEEGCRI
ncbi:MAG: hypothetical protein WDO16_19275 [Bacteroidota bacterium]